MNNLFVKTNLNSISKICLAGLLMALATVLQKVLAINYIPVVPFLRISLGGPGVIIFASIFLGPLYGFIVGAGSDILGYFILDMSGNAFFPQITAIYGLLGIVPYFIFSLFKRISNKKIMFVVESLGLSASFMVVTLFVLLNDSMKLYGSVTEFGIIQKIIIPVALFLLLGLVLIFVVFFNKRLEKQEINPVMNAYQISFSLLIIEILVMVIFGTLMKGWAFGFATYPAILICQIITLFINVPLNTIIISILLKLTRKRFINVGVN